VFTHTAVKAAVEEVNAEILFYCVYRVVNQVSL
jgi:hypothetical protein